MTIKIKSWEHITNGLITITVLGGVVTYFINTAYAERYKFWFKNHLLPTSKKLVLYVERIFNKLDATQKEVILDYATNYAEVGSKKILEALDADEKIKIPRTELKKIIKVGSEKIAELAKK